MQKVMAMVNRCKFLLYSCLFFSQVFCAVPLPNTAQILISVSDYDSQDTDLSSYALTFPINSYSSIDVPILGNFCINSADSEMDPLLVNDASSRFFSVYQNSSWFIKTGSVVVDIGAKSGGYAFGFKKIDSALTVYAFEHDLKQFTQMIVNQNLQSSFAINYQRIGLSDTSGWVNPGSGYPNKNGTVNSTRGPGLVQILPLDSFGLMNVSFIKINAGGNELDVLNGANTTITQSLPTVLILFSGGEIDYTTADIERKNYIDSCVNFLLNLNYTSVYLYGSTFLFLSSQSQFR